MNDLERATAQTNLARALSIEEANIQSVDEQIKELQEHIAIRRNQNEAMREQIKLNLEQDKQDKADITILRKKRSIFSRSAFALREVDRA